MVNQQKGVQQETAYSAVVVNDRTVAMYPYSWLYRFYIPLFGQKRYRDVDIHSLELHCRQFLVALVFADLPSLSPFIS